MNAVAGPTEWNLGGPRCTILATINYQLLEKLPPETLASVYRAVERTTGAEVKIYYWELPLPVLSPRERRTRDKINELLRAATYLSRLSHPGIARIFDSGESDGWFYLATEMIEGAA